MTDERLATPLRRRAPQSRWWLATLGGLLLAMALTLLAHRWGFMGVAPWMIPAFLFAASLVLVWSPLESAVQSDARRPDVVALFSKDAWARVVLGLVLAIVTLVWFAQWEFSDDPVLRVLLMPVVVLVAFALILAPWWLRLIRQVGVERERRVREFERAEIAAHLHDSVLQTLTLIRAKANDPDAVSRLARAQERDLRAYLYQDRRSEDDSVATALQQAVSEVEDAHGVTVDVVHVGDAPTARALRAAVKAAREAVQNAARHGSEPISVYAELTADRYEVFVRDSGPGFDPTQVPEDRAGIRNSIVGRARRYGGDASIASAPGGRTEVTISVPRQEE
ncbi:sensor histidine kinase [Demequina sp. NBRC 110054]|uniref:sensor histidine kinase n=1 Tax=Demequina sp. NBRC 110054 TaxID=1570343 RepID=UPI0009FF6A1B|nr:ATP-binding protein [Demequina sp. NBRC 110054]